MLALLLPDGARLLWFGGQNCVVKADDPEVIRKRQAQLDALLAGAIDDASIEVKLRSIANATVLVDRETLKQVTG